MNLMQEEVSVLLEKATEKIKGGRDTLNMINSSENGKKRVNLEKLIDSLNRTLSKLDEHIMELRGYFP